MPPEPVVKRTVAFIDGQNLFHTVREAFGYSYPNFDVQKLAHQVVAGQAGWQLIQVRFYTGIPAPADNAHWHQFWTRKLLAMSRAGVHTYARSLRYRNKQVHLPSGSVHTFLVGEEKGIDVRLAVDITRLAHRDEYDVALIFSQDQDLSEVAEEIRQIARERSRWIKIASTFPYSPTIRNRRGINHTDWIRIDRATYDACIDARDYRLSSSGP
jgi:uncharacterized LabA/DUF88 family protein